MATWEKIGVAILAAVVAVWFIPRIKAQMAQSRQVERPDWAGVLLPLAVVVAFVLLLIALV